MKRLGSILLIVLTIIIILLVGAGVTWAKQSIVCLYHEAPGNPNSNWTTWMPEASLNGHIGVHPNDEVRPDSECGSHNSPAPTPTAIVGPPPDPRHFLYGPIIRQECRYDNVLICPIK